MHDQQVLYPSEYKDRLKNVPYTFNSPLTYVTSVMTLKNFLESLAKVSIYFVYSIKDLLSQLK